LSSDVTSIAKLAGIVSLVVALCIGAGMVGCPTYKVYKARMDGEAELAQANQNRQISVAQSKAKAEAATYEAQAEVTRAQGVAKANLIIGDSLKNNEGYLRYLFVNNLAETKDQVIYIPTEAGLPILEAGHRPAAPVDATDGK
jgi:regulator of protease activity HflC (stomatin/prohibitin superfamily)